jgi:5-methyltetrahydropteroyltriglutamate--homocysteine methyltransferase
MIQAFAPGLYPRSEALVQATRDLDRRRTTAQAVDEQIARDLEELVQAQQSAGLDLLTDGMFRWQDLFRPLVDEAEGLERGALTRFLDTNTFYRAPSATTATPRLSKPLGEEYVAPLPGPRLVTLPSPWALARGTGVPAKTIAEDVLKPQLESLEADLVVLSEPFLAREGTQELEELAPALEALSGGETPVAIQFTFCDARELLEAGAAELPVDGIGIDFYATHVTDVPEGLDKLLLAGVVDARSSVLEEPRELAAFAERLRSERGIERVALTPNGDLQYVSQPIAQEKLARLGKAKTATTEAAA